MKQAILALPVVLCLTMLSDGALAQPVSEPAQGGGAEAGASSLEALFSQATFWRANNRPDLAGDALRRVLAVEPGNPRALRGMGELALAAGDRETAGQWLERLLAQAPDSEDAARLQAALRREKISNGDLMEARALAKAGNAAGAVARYEALFDGAGPPPDLALEYYQTLAGVDARWGEARDGLAQVVRDNPNDLAARQALAEVLTYRQATRDQGIELLAALWRDQQRLQVIAPWRQALLWLPQEPASADALRDYLAVRPDDAVVRERLDSVLSGSGGAAAAAEYAVQTFTYHGIVGAHRQVVAQGVRRGGLLRQPQQRLPPRSDYLQALLVAPQRGQQLDALIAGGLAVGEHFRQRLAGGQVVGVIAHHLCQPVAGLAPAGVDTGQGLVILQRQVRRWPGTIKQGFVTGHGAGGVARFGQGARLHQIAVADLFAA